MYTLFIDESGKNDLQKIVPNRPHVSLASVIVKNGDKDILKIEADKIKFKYWGNNGAQCFHASDMRKLSGIFSTFNPANNPPLTIDDFRNDLLYFLTNQDIKLGLVCTNKINYLAQNPTIAHALQKSGASKKSNWHKVIQKNRRNLLKEIAHKTYCMFLQVLIQDGVTGQIVFEASDLYQDVILMEAYNEILAFGCKELNLQKHQVRDLLTGISFVTKKNDDIETQIADLTAYYLNLDSRVLDGIETITKGGFEDQLITTLKSKTFPYQDATGNITHNSYTKLY